MGRTTRASQDGIARSWEQEVGVEEAGRVRKDVGKVILDSSWWTSGEATLV